MMIKTTPKYIFLLIICCWLLSCNNNGLGTNNLILNNFNTESKLLSPTVENSGSIITFLKESILLNKSAKKSRLVDFALNDRLAPQNFLAYKKSNAFNLESNEKIVKSHNSVNNPEHVSDHIITNRKSRHNAKLKFNHYDRHVVSTQTKDFSTEEVWATITDFSSSRLN